MPRKKIMFPVILPTLFFLSPSKKTRILWKCYFYYVKCWLKLTEFFDIIKIFPTYLPYIFESRWLETWFFSFDIIIRIWVQQKGYKFPTCIVCTFIKRVKIMDSLYMLVKLCLIYFCIKLLIHLLIYAIFIMSNSHLQ